MLGPVQVLVVGTDGPEGAPAVLGSLAALPDDAPVRLLDSFVVEVGDDGGVEVDAAGSPTLALFAGEADDGDGDGTADGATWSIADAVPAGTSAVVVVLEHRWAIGLVEGMRAAGGSLVHESWLDEQDRAELEALLSRG
jgi:Family of unknown function (DUF6325)